MAYLPHAVPGATGSLHGTVSKVQLVANGSTGGLKNLILLEVKVINFPGSKRLYGVRYYGTLQLSIVSTNQVFNNSATGSFDKLFVDALSYTDQAGLDAAVSRALMGRVVNAINVGGRYIIR